MIVITQVKPQPVSTQGNISALLNVATDAEWTMFVAATASDTKTRDILVGMVHSKAATNSTPGVFPTTYDVNTGSTTTGSAK